MTASHRGISPARECVEREKSGFMSTASQRFVGIVLGWLTLVFPGWGFAQPPDNATADSRPRETAPILNPDLLEGVNDNKLFPDFRGKAPDEIDPKEKQEYDAYCEALLLASITSDKAFANSARPNDALTYGHLFHDPWMHRGKVVTIKGRLKRLREWLPPRPVFRQGVEKYYEGWIYADTPGSNPVCVMIAEVPPGMKLGEWIDYPVVFHGYFFKKYHYFTAKDQRVTLLCIGRTVTPVATVGRSIDSGLSTGFLMGIVGFIVTILLAVILLHWMLSRGDRRFRNRIARIQEATPWSGTAENEPGTLEHDSPTPPQARGILPNGN
jgi:hypothetical protein